MKKITENLFYSTQEGILFWVAGYTRDGSTDKVVEIIESLNSNAQTFADHAGVPLDEVFTFYNERPPRYQYMRIFYTYVPKNLEGAYKIGKDWTMYKWLTS